MSKWRAFQWMTYTGLTGLVSGAIWLISADVDKVSPPIRLLVWSVRSHYRASLVVSGMIVILLACAWLYASRQEDFEKIARIDHVRLFIPSARLNYHHFEIANPNPYFMEHSESQLAQDSLAKQGRLLILGRPSAGKTRLAFQLAKAAKKTWILRLGPEFTKFDLLNFPTVPFRCRVLCFFDDADKFLGKLDLSRVERLLSEQCKLQIIVTCQLESELHQVHSSREMMAFLATLPRVECRDFSKPDLLTLARQVGKPEVPRLYDGTPGSVILALKVMSDRLRAASPQAQATMKALFLLRAAFIFSPSESLVQATIQAVYGLKLSEETFEAALASLCRPPDDFVRREEFLMARHDAFLTLRFFPYYHSASTLEADLERVSRVVEDKGTPQNVQSVGTLWKTRENYERAILCLQRAAAHITDDEVLYLDLGFCFIKTGNLDEAIICYRKALEISPREPGILNNLGKALKAKGLFDEAIACLREALEIRPNHAATLFNLGKALMDKGLLDEAISCYRKALEINPADADTHYNLARALAAKGITDESVVSYRKAMQIKD